MNRDDESSRIWPNQTWDKALDSPGAGQMGYLRRLMESRPFLERIPDQDILLGENPSYASDHIRVTRDGTKGEGDATYIMAYLPYYKSFKINTDVISGNRLKVWWYNPTNGFAFLQGVIENTGVFEFSNWDELIKEGVDGPDWVLLIDDAGAGYAVPGS